MPQMQIFQQPRQGIDYGALGQLISKSAFPQAGIQQQLMPLLLRQKFEAPFRERELGLREAGLEERRRQADIQKELQERGLAAEELQNALTRAQFIEESLREAEGKTPQEIDEILERARAAGIPKEILSGITKGLAKKKKIRQERFMQSLIPRASWMLPPVGVGGISRLLGYASGLAGTQNLQTPKMQQLLQSMGR